MGKIGKLIKIEDDRSVYIIADDKDQFIRKDSTIHYKNVGKDFNLAVLHENNVRILNKGEKIEVLNKNGKTDFFFPGAWLDTTNGKIMELQEKGLLQVNNA